MPTLGGVVSRLTVACTVLLLPARSVAVPLTSCWAPSVVIVTGGVTVATPDRLSVAGKLTVTAVLFHPLLLGAGVRTGERLGGVVSILNVTERVAVLPARSTAVPVIVCCAPSVATVLGAEQKAIPLVLSAHVKLTVTGVWCHPATLGEETVVAVIVGWSS